VSYAVLQPAAGRRAGQLFGTETLSMFLIVLIIGLCLSVPRLAGAVPWIVGLFIGAAIALLGTTSGGSESPARQFGPAIASGQTRFLWAYLLAPRARSRAGRRRTTGHPPGPPGYDPPALRTRGQAIRPGATRATLIPGRL
jgi:glycerol uptake facilitator-like aquaporin